MKRFIVPVFIFLFFVGVVHAAPNPSANNKFGISLLQPTDKDIAMAAALVNSQGGDWGYVTLVIQENDKDKPKWQELFDELRRKHLIPIVRIATRPEGENWRRPKAEDADSWVQFLDSLNWVVKERYIVLFNEPNHATEWGGEVDPSSYAAVANSFAKKLKEKNGDFFVMLAGFDAAAPSYPNTYEDEGIFLEKMLSAQPSLFDYIDGWSSHSYPNPGFSGTPWDMGRKSIRGYEWELQYLNSLGVSKKLPVFITETGWIAEKLSRDTIASYYRVAFENIWGEDSRVVAVTPFVFNYQSPPFSGFSWKQQGTDDKFHPQYEEVLGIAKMRGNVQQVESGDLTIKLPGEFVESSNYHLTFRLKNSGQAIWDKEDGYGLVFLTQEKIPFEYFFSDIKDLEPFDETEMSLFMKTNTVEGEHRAKIALQKNNEIIAQTDEWKFTILPLPRLTLQASLYPKVESKGSDFEIQVYDEREGLVYKKKGLQIGQGKGVVDEVQNIVLGKKYRVVLLKPYYLPRQTFITFQREGNTAKFKRMLPFDFNRDGRMGFEDVGELFKHPNLLGLFVP